jgi:hypothetical protein
MEKIITYCGQPAKVGCDEKCNKAWGGRNRPRVYLEVSETKIYGVDVDLFPDEEDIDVDNYAYCTDAELGDAPVDPGTGEGGDFKPVNKSEIGNKWCIRECERCSMSEPGEYEQPLILKDFTKRFYNCYPHTR